MLAAVVLTVIAVGFRLLVPYLSASWSVDIWNFVPMGAVALYAGSRLPRRWAWLVPVAAMMMSDAILDRGSHRPLFELSRWMIYAAYGCTSLLGAAASQPRKSVWLLPALALLASTLFYVVSNFAVWADGSLYPLTPAGLAVCYWAAIPFFGRTILADLIGTGLLFGVGPVFDRAARRLARPRPAETGRL
jgi:Family of unknown function (DUF6580)